MARNGSVFHHSLGFGVTVIRDSSESMAVAPLVDRLLTLRNAVLLRRLWQGGRSQGEQAEP